VSINEADQFDVDPRVIAEAASAADQLAEQVRRDGDAVAWTTLEAGLDQYEDETGASADELLPADAPRLAFAGLDRAKEYARKVLCNRKDEVRGPIEAGIMGGSPALIAALFGVLSLPVVALPVVVAIAGVLMVRGLDGMCKSAGGS
jgi:hypothetical protein